MSEADPVLNVAILGCGRIAQGVHLPVLQGLAGVRVTVLADPSSDALQAASKRFPEAARLEQWPDAIARDDVDAVVICLPTDLHAAATVAAIDGGKHCYAEKPIAIDAEGAASVLDAVNWRPNLKAMAGFNYRFHPVINALRDRVDAGEIGNVVALRTAFCAAPRQLPEWKAGRATGGGVLLDLASHHVDLVRYLTGREVGTVDAEVRSLRSEGDNASLRLRLTGGLVADVLVSMTGAEQDEITVFGDAGTLVSDRLRGHVTRRATHQAYDKVAKLRAATKYVGELKATLLPRGGTAHYQALSHFVNCVRSNRPPRVSMLDGARSLSIVLAAERSAAEEGRRVRPDEALLIPSPEVPAVNPDAPTLSCVLVAADGYDSVRPVLAALRNQTIAERIELILVMEKDPRVKDLGAGFHSAHVVETAQSIDNVDAAAGVGIRHARAPIVSSNEDHAYPEPDWAERVVAAFESPGGPWAAVGSAMDNANPTSSLSWMNMLLGYGTWCEPVRRGPTREVSLHNITFRRSALEPLMETLPERMGRAGDLLQELLLRGERFYIEPAARVRHLNPSRLRSTLALRFHGGRNYGATKARSQNWSRRRRATYALLSPAIPLLRFRLLHRKARSAGWSTFPALIGGLLLDGLGQGIGFATGPGRSKTILEAFEHDRPRHLSRRDRGDLEALAR